MSNFDDIIRILFPRYMKLCTALQQLKAKIPRNWLQIAGTDFTAKSDSHVIDKYKCLAGLMPQRPLQKF